MSSIIFSATYLPQITLLLKDFFASFRISPYPFFSKTPSKVDGDFQLKSIVPHKSTKTKRTGITFYNGEVDPLLRKFLTETDDPETKLFHNGEGAIRKQLIKAWKKAGVKVTLQMLSVWFCNRMGELGVQDRYIDIFCGRAPKSVLAKHYTSREIKKLKAIYDRANLKLLA